MNPFSKKNNQLYIEECALSEIAIHCGTPCYVYSAAAVCENYSQFVEHAGKRAQICYSVKANSNQAILSILADAGAGADIVSEGEGRRALAAGIKPEHIFFSGVGKSNDALRFALSAGLAQINVESADELMRLSEISKNMKKVASCAIRINPNIQTGGHDKISTGRAKDKFGVNLSKAFSLYQKASEDPFLKISAIAMHIGSQIHSMEVFQRAFDTLGGFAVDLRNAGMKVKRLDLGGGLGISEQHDLKKDIKNYGSITRKIAEKFDCEIILSPGRSIVGSAGCLLTSIIEVKKVEDKNFIILDAAMNDFLRPTFYQAQHPIWPVSFLKQDSKILKYELVGQICEAGDVLGYNLSLPCQESGSLLAVMHAGAYGAVHSSYYNSRLLVPEILVQREQFSIIRARPNYRDLISMDNVPSWIKK